MKLEGNKVVFELHECISCWGSGQVADRENCPVCHGTDRTKGGKGKGRCRNCLGGTVYSKTLKRVCSNCNGSGKVMENNCDTMPHEMYLALPFKVYRHKRELTYGENLLGWGCVYSCVDYGRAAKATDEQVLADVRSKDHCHVQLCKVANKENELCDHVGIFVAENGYSVRAVYRQDGLDALRAIVSENSYSDGMAQGLKIARDGGNGTIGGIYKN